MLKKCGCMIFLFLFFLSTARADDTIKWVDFDVPVSALETAMNMDIASQEQEQPLKWTSILALAGTEKGSGKGTPDEVKDAAQKLLSGETIDEILGSQKK